MKIRRINEFLNESFKDDLKGFSIDKILKHTDTYKSKVRNCLYQIVMDEQSISEKNFTKLDKLSINLEKFYEENQQELDKIIKYFEDTEKRAEYCAEKIYDEFVSEIDIL